MIWHEKNVIWRDEHGGFHVHFLLETSESSAAYAEDCQQRGAVPSQWSVECTDAGPEHPAHRVMLEAEAWERLRADRDARLSAALAVLDRHRNQVDFGLSATLTTEQAHAWAVYAQALRDLPEATVDPTRPEWPEAPQ